MEDNAEPIYDFSRLRQFLVDRGFIVEKAQAYKEIKPEELTIDAIEKGDIEFSDSAIYVLGPSHEKQQIFLYMRDYKIQQYGKPRFHICKCNVIEEFIETGGFRQHYVRANSDPVPVRNRDNGYEEVMVKDLPICRACLEKLRENCQDELAEDFDGINSSLFVKMLKEANGEEEIKEAQEVDIFGYTRDWDRISKAYREKKNYTCEKCGLQIDNLYDRQYIHCHHKDFNKLNNKESNLQCLCMRCHANIDDNHRKNLTTGANGIIFKTFNAKYPNKKGNKPNDEEPESRISVPF